MSAIEKLPTQDFMTMEVIDHMDQSAESVTAFVKQLRALNITKLAEDEKKEYLDIVGRYEDILERLLMYIGNEKPKFEYLQVVVTQERPDIYETLCKEIDIETPTKIYADISDLQTLVRDRKQMLGSKRREQLFQLLVIGGTGICLVIASILNARFALNGPCNATSLIVPIIASAFAMFSGPNGFKMIFELILNGAEHAELNLIDSNLATLEKHLSDVREKCEELNQANKSFSYDLRFENFKVEDHDHIEIVEGYIGKSKCYSTGNQCHMCRLMIICKRLARMEDVIRDGV